MTTIVEVTKTGHSTAVGGWIPSELADVPSDTPVRTGGCRNMGGVKFKQWETVFHRDEFGNVEAEYSAGIDPVSRGRAEMRAHQRSRIERVRARLQGRLAAKGSPA